MHRTIAEVSQPAFLDFHRLDRRLRNVRAACHGHIYGRVPLFFVENRVPAGEPARFVVKGPELSGYFALNNVTVRIGQSNFRVSFPGASPDVRLEASQRLSGHVNFLYGDASQWQTNLNTYEKLTYHTLFPGIDLIYSASGAHLKSDFRVAPGADPSLIRLDFGSQPVDLERGALVLRTAAGEFREEAPVIYQIIEGRRRNIIGAFRLVRDGSVAFTIGAYNRAQTLIIDPVLSYSTYLGGGAMDAITSIAADNAGNAYVAGWTTSADLPTVNPIRAMNGGGVDAFVANSAPAATP